MACQNAAFAEREISSIDEDFLMARRRGAIAALGSTGYGVPLVQQRVLQDMFAEMGRGKSRTLGEIFTRAEAMLGRYPGNIYRGVFFQCCLLGDPLTRMPFDTVIRPVVLPGSVTVVDREGSAYVTEDKDSAYVRFRLFNAGVSSDDSVAIALVRRFDSSVDTVWYVVPSICNVDDIEIPVGTRGMTGDHFVRLVIDPLNTLLRNIVRDSAVSVVFRVYSPQPLPIEPLPRWDVSSTRPLFRFTFSAPERLKDRVHL
ncbi:MAG: C25 family cysteine peptidase, partial [Candidatus Kapaibacterium sp.]